MTDLFAKRRARLLALKALRDGQSHLALDNTLAAPCPACGAVASKRELAKSGRSPRPSMSALSAGTTTRWGPITGCGWCWTPVPSGSWGRGSGPGTL